MENKKQQTLCNIYWKSIVLLLLSGYSSIALGQQYTVQLFTSSTAIVNSQYPETNYSGSGQTALIAESAEDESSYTKRSYFEISLSSIPSNAIIHSATLYLEGLDHAPLEEGMVALLTFPSQTWEEQGIYWDNQPYVPLENYLELDNFSSATQDFSLDLTQHIRNLIYFPGSYTDYGYCLRLEEEYPTQKVSFHSEASPSGGDPYLEIDYELPIDLEYSFSFIPMKQDGTGTGSIRMNITEGNPPYTYQWSDGSSTIGTGEQITNLSAGIYYLTVTDNINREFTFERGVGYNPEWKDEQVLQYTAFPNTIEKVSGYGWNEAVGSESLLSAGSDGWMEYTVEDIKHKMFGFAKPADYQSGYTKIRAGIYLREDRNLIRVVNGGQTSIGTYDLGDVVRIQKEGENFKFYLNGTLKNTYNYSGINAEDLLASATMYTPTTRFSKLTTSFRRKLMVRLYVENQSKGKTDGDIFAFPMYGTPPYTYAWSNSAGNVDRIQGLSAGTYTVTVSDGNGGVGIQATVVYADPDAAKNWQAAKYYDEAGNLLGASKGFSDYNGKTTQALQFSPRVFNVFAQQQVYDTYGRAAVSSLSAPSFHDRLDYQSGFFDASNGQPYAPEHFDMNTPSTAGDVHLPFPVEKTQSGTLGWWYSDNNTLEAYQDRTDYPYTRSVYGQYDPTQVVENAAPHDAFRMGSGHEEKKYILPAAGELVHMFGYGRNWEVGTNYTIIPNDPGVGGIGVLNTDHLAYDYQVYKQISYSPDGLESVSFVDNEGKLIASGLSGTNDNGQNERLMNIRSIISGDCNDGPRYVDIHIPEGCEASLDLLDYQQASTYTFVKFDIIDLISGEKIHSEITTNPSSIPPGIYRIVDKTYMGENYKLRTDLPDLHIKHQVNYHHLSLNYYNKKGQVVATVDPEGFSGFTPNLSTYTDAGFRTFNLTSAYLDWEFDNGLKQFTKSLVPPASNETQFTNVTLFFEPNALQVLLNSGGGSEEFEHNPSMVPEGGENDPDSAISSFTAGEFTYVGAGAAYMRPGGGGGTYTPDCGNGSAFFTSMALAQSYCGSNGIQYSSVVPGGYCVTCRTTTTPPGGCNLGERPHAGKFELSFQITVLSASGNTPLNTISIHATKDKYGYWSFENPQGQVLNNNNYGAVTAVIDPLLSQTATGVEIKLTKLKYKYPLESLIGCYWEELLYPPPASGEGGTNLEFSGLNTFKLYYDITTHNMGAFPQHQLNATFAYNSVDEVLRTTTRDAGTTEYVYTEDGLLRFSQSEQQRAEGKFSYTNYDALNRPLEMGIVDESAQALKFQNHFGDITLASGDPVTDPTTLEFVGALIDNSANAISGSATEEETYVRYDLPDMGLSYLGAPFSGYEQKNLRGRMAHVWNENTASWYSYLSDGRLEWLVNNYYNLGAKSIHYTYNALGNVEQIIYQKDNAADYFEHKYSYDRVGNLSKVYTRTAAAGAYTLEAEYSYALDGGLKRVVINEDLQGLDYIYNTLGMIKAINSPNLGESIQTRYFLDPGRDNGTTVATDIFGMSFDYFNGDYTKAGTKVISGTAQKEYFDGKLAAIRWDAEANPANTDEQLSYDLDYTKHGWIKSAFFTTVGPFGNNTTAPATTTGAFGQYSLSNLDYDKNGNIKKLTRQGDAAVNTSMDDFTYRYDPEHPNRLALLEDAVNAGNYADDLDNQGSWDPNNSATWNYVYDAEGQLIEDKQAGLKYEYNAYGLVAKIQKDHGSGYLDFVSYDYDNMGLRSRKISHNSSGLAQAYTWYVRDASGAEVARYRQNVGQSVQAPAYPLLADARLGEYDRATDSRVYELMDHLGNVRATFGRDANNSLTIYSYADYYPFGSPLPGRNQISSPQYEHGYQGQFTTKDEETGLDAFELRMWDSRLARWHSTDPYGQFASPYLGMGNNPISGVDSDGGLSGWATAGIGAAVGGGIGYAATGTLEGAVGGALIGGAIGYGFGGIGGGSGTSGGSGTLGNGEVLSKLGNAGTVKKGFDAGFAITNSINSIATFGNSYYQASQSLAPNINLLASNTGCCPPGTPAIYREIYSIGQSIEGLWTAPGAQFAKKLLPGIQLLEFGQMIEARFKMLHSMTINQLQKAVEKGQAPNDIDRFDKGNPDHGELDHVHFKNGSALNRNGTWKHGSYNIPNRTKTWLRLRGWQIP